MNSIFKIVGFVLALFVFSVVVEQSHCKKRKHSKAIVLLDTLKHLPRSVCNSGHWFRYEDSLDSFNNQEVRSVNLPKGSTGIWLLEHEPFGKITTTSRAPCMEVLSETMLYDQIEIHYFLKGSQSNFSIFEYGEHTLLSTVSSPSQENGKWDHIRIHQPGLFLLGFQLTANIAKEDFLMIDKVLARSFTFHSQEGKKDHAKKV